MTDSQIRDAYVDVVNNTAKHGSFLLSFADAMLRADSKNFSLLKPAAEKLIEKYDLARAAIAAAEGGAE